MCCVALTCVRLQVLSSGKEQLKNLLGFSSLRVLCALRFLGGNIRSGFGGLGGGMLSALVGCGYGWDGWVVCFVGGVFSGGGVVRRVWGVFCLACEE